ncbi:TPA: hypothetical protein EYP66_09225 [Candidatus Poribacteria bacterium]|nr:hypothetical protein [Candidatus Poribacteria bacterium]
MNKWLITFLTCSLMFVPLLASVDTEPNTESERPSLSEETEECFECHSIYTPGIVEDWLADKSACHGNPLNWNAEYRLRQLIK